MSTIYTRAGKGSPLEWAELDANFTNLNTDKVEKTSAAITGGTINGTTIGATTPAAGTFTTLTAQTEVLTGTGQNLVLQSENFTVTWATSGSAGTGATANAATSPTGTSNASKIFELSATGVHGRSQAVSLGRIIPVTYSMYAKASERTKVRVDMSDLLTGDIYQDFDLSTGSKIGSVVSSGSWANTSSAIISVGSGWYRCSITGIGGNTAVAGVVQLLDASGAVSYVGNGTSGIFAWGAQLELASSVGTYIPTTTTAVYGTPTLSFSGVASVGLQSDGSLYASSAGTGAVRFYTNNIGQEQARVSHTASAVNYHQLTGSATGSGPIHSVAGSDTNIDLNLTPKGAGAVKATNATNMIVYSIGQSGYGSFLAQGSTGNPAYYFGYSGSSEVGRITMGGNIDFGTSSSALLQLRVANTASAVNYVQVTGGTTGSVNGTTISSQGSDADVNLRVVPKGAGYLYVRQDSTASTGILLQNRSSTGSPEMGIRFITGGFDLSDSRYAEISSTGGGSNTLIFKTGNGTSPQEFLRIAANGDMTLGGSNTAPNFKIFRSGSAVNYLQVTGSATGVAPVLSAQGSDTNIPLVVQPKGTGALQAQQTDSTATGGNARGTNAVDWQTVRSGATQVAANTGCVIGGGSGNTASSLYSGVASGLSNLSNNLVTIVAGGQSNTASGGYSAVLGGIGNTVAGYISVIGGGNTNSAAGYYNFIGGGFTNSGTSFSAVTTQSATMNGTTAVTLAASNASIKVGQYITGTSIAGDTYVSAISGTSLTLSKVASGSSTSTLSFYTPHGVVVGGGNNQATGSYSFIGGGGDAGNTANRNVASGDWSTIAGGNKNTASGKGAFIGGNGGDGAAFYGNIASGISSTIVCGTNNTVTSTAGFVGAGISHNNTGAYGFIGGGAQNTVNSTAGGIVAGFNGTTRSVSGNHVFPACAAPIANTSGVSQSSLLVLGRQTTDATSTVLASDANAASTINQVILPNNSAYYFKGSVIANVTGAANGASWSFEGAIMRGANAASTVLMGTPAINRVAATAGATAWVIALTADTTNGGLAVTVTGAASTTIRWVCKAETTEVTF
jgi:hypothetical protein